MRKYLFLILLIFIGVFFCINRDEVSTTVKNEVPSKPVKASGHREEEKPNSINEQRLANGVAEVAEALLNFPEYLQEFESLRTKVLKSESELLRYHRILSDRRNIRKSVLSLLEHQEKSEIKRKMPVRVSSSNFLVSAVSWKENPQREYLIESIESLILYKELTDEPVSLKRARSGDKAELYSALYIYAPEAAQKIKDVSQGTRLHDLLSFTESLFELASQRKSYEENQK